MRHAILSLGFLAAAGAWLAASQAAPPSPQTPAQPQVTFRVDANYIEVDAVVTDAKGTFVRGLGPQDFEVLDEKRPQSIDVFAVVDIPLERFDRPAFKPTAIPVDVVTNEKPFDGRVYVLLLDANHVPATDSFIVKRAARQFVEQHLGANDIAAVVHTQVGWNEGQEFTNSKAALMAAIDKFVGDKVPSRTLSVIASAESTAGVQAGLAPEPKDSYALERAAKASATLDTVAKISNFMAGIRGRRKAVVLFSEGIDYNINDAIGPRSLGTEINPVVDNSVSEAIHAQTILGSLQTMLEAASRANVAVYSVDPRGIPNESELLMQFPGTSEGLKYDAGAVSAGVREELRRQLSTLRTLAEATGGLALVSTNDFAGGFRRIVEDNSAYYVLGYRPTNLERNGKFREITVRVKRPGLQVRARRGYYAARDTSRSDVPPVDPAIALLNSPMPVGGLGLRLTTSMLKGADPNVQVFVTAEVSGRQLTLEAKDGATSGKVDVSYAAVDMTGKVRASGRKTLDVPLNAGTRAAVIENGLRLVTELSLPPGQYQLRVAAHESLGGRTGSVFWDLSVPDFGKPSLVMTPLAITSTRAGRAPTSFDAPGFANLLPAPPTANREFDLDETLAVFTEIYDNDTRLHNLDLSATVRTDTGAEVFATREDRSSRDVSAPRGGHAFLARIPLRDLIAGRYVLTVEARSRLGGEAAVREVEFSVK